MLEAREYIGFDLSSGKMGWYGEYKDVQSRPGERISDTKTLCYGGCD